MSQLEMEVDCCWLLLHSASSQIQDSASSDRVACLSLAYVMLEPKPSLSHVLSCAVLPFHTWDQIKTNRARHFHWVWKQFKPGAEVSIEEKKKGA